MSTSTRAARVVGSTSEAAKALAQGATIRVSGGQRRVVTLTFPAQGTIRLRLRADGYAPSDVPVPPSVVKTSAVDADTAYIVVVFNRGGATKVGCHSSLALAQRKARQYGHAAIVTGAEAFQAVGSVVCDGHAVTGEEAAL